MEIVEVIKDFFNGSEIRVLGATENPLFVANDIGKVLGISKINEGLRDFDDDEKIHGIVKTQGGDQRMSLLTEKGLYRVLYTSRKPIAKVFRSWVYQLLHKIRINYQNLLVDELKILRQNLEETKITGEIGYVYFITEMPFSNKIKIGMSKNPIDRLKQLQTGNPQKLVIYHTVESTDYKRLEKTMHDICKDLNILGEWFEINESQLTGIISGI